MRFVHAIAHSQACQITLYGVYCYLDAHGEIGFLDNTRFPCDGADSYLLPTDDYPGNGASAWGF
jgi:hypothetical protein